MAEKTKGKNPKNAGDMEHGPDFKFIVRMVNTDIDGERKILDGLTSITGVNYRISQIITRQLGVPSNKLMGDLTDEEVAKLITLIEEIPANLPTSLPSIRTTAVGVSAIWKASASISPAGLDASITTGMICCCTRAGAAGPNTS